MQENKTGFTFKNTQELSQYLFVRANIDYNQYLNEAILLLGFVVEFSQHIHAGFVAGQHSQHASQLTLEWELGTDGTAFVKDWQ